MLNHRDLYSLSGSIKFAFLRPKRECALASLKFLVLAPALDLLYLEKVKLNSGEIYLGI